MKYTRLTVDGVEPGEVTVEFLADVMDAAEAEGLDVRGVGIDWDGSAAGDDGSEG